MTASEKDEETAAENVADIHGSLTGLFDGLGTSQPNVIEAVWQRFFPRMTALARRTIGSMPSGGLDPDDIAQSAFISFWRALDRGAKLQFEGRDDLWKLLVVITVRKTRKRARYHLAEKRGGGRTVTESDLFSAQSPQGVSPLSQALASVGPAELDMMCEEMLLRLKDEQRTIALLRMQAYSSDEIAARLGCSARTVQRHLETVAEQWERMIREV